MHISRAELDDTYLRPHRETGTYKKILKLKSSDRENGAAEEVVTQFLRLPRKSGRFFSGGVTDFLNDHMKTALSRY